MGRKELMIILAMIAGAIIGTVIGYGIVQSALGAALGAVIGVALVAGGIGLSVVGIPAEIWVGLAEFSQIADCCSSVGVLSLASIITLAGLLLWHSLALAALAGVSVMTGLLLALSFGLRSYLRFSAV